MVGVSILAALVTTTAPIPHTPGDHFWWYAGLSIGFAVVVVVVIVVAAILGLAARIGAQARAGIHLMDRARVTTLPVWALQETNSSLTGIWRAAQSTRASLQHLREGGRR